MNNINIKKLIVSGTKGTSSIEFGEHLTIIAGPSDTGKSYIYKCIDYIFGAKKENKPFDPAIGYDTITCEFTNGVGTVSVQRTIDSNEFIVTSNIPSILSGSYKIKDNKHFDKTINSVYCKLLGINDQVMIPTNKNGKTASFTWRTIKQAFMFHEDEIERELPILLPKENTAQTNFLSALLFILYNQDFSDYDETDSKKTKAAKKAAVQKYINTQRDNLKKQTEEISKKINDLKNKGLSPEDIIKQLEDKISAVEASIDESLEINRSISTDIFRVQDKIQNLNITLNKYKGLASQYKADVKRLTFIVDNETISESKQSNLTCPFCNSHIKAHTHVSYVEAAKGELKKTLLNLEELSKQENEIKNQLKDAKLELKDYLDEKDEITITLNKELLPQKDSLISELQEYQNYMQSQFQLDLFEKMDSQFSTDLEQLDVKIDEVREYKPKELFNPNFVEKIAEFYKEIITAVNYSPVDSTSFDIDAFDIILNDEVKRSHGKGYRALLNSVLILALRNYINEYAVYNPHFYFIDSPLHGLSLKGGISDDENVRKGFFTYLANNCKEDQIIIIENTEDHELPQITGNDVKIIKFSQDQNEGRYGFLTGVIKK